MSVGKKFLICPILSPMSDLTPLYGTQYWAHRAFIVELVWLSEPVRRLGGHIVACWLSGWICKCQASLYRDIRSGTGRSKLHDLPCSPPPTPTFSPPYNSFMHLIILPILFLHAFSF